MIERDILSYPVLASDASIQEYLSKISSLREELSLTDKKLGDGIKLLQENCEHTLEKVMKHDSNYIWGVYNSWDGNMVFQGSNCSKCGIFIPRRAGSPWKICHKCGGDMEFDGRAPGQGGDGYSYYHCKDCGYKSCHT